MSEQPDRRTYIGGSDAAAILGYGATYDGVRQTPYTVWTKKIAHEPDEMEPARKLFLERRKRWEPVVVQMLREEFDAEITGFNLRYQDEDYPFLACEIDFEWKVSAAVAESLGLDSALVGTTQNGEIKTVHVDVFRRRTDPLFAWGEPGSGDIPINYDAQVQHGLGVTKRQVCIVAALVGIDNLVFYVVHRNDETLTDMRGRLVPFWNENVLKRVPPEPQSIEDLSKLYPKSNGLEVAADSEVGSKAMRLRALVAQIDAFELERESLEFDVLLALKDKEALMVDGRKVATWKEQAWSRLDQAALKEQEKDIYRKYMRSGKHRVFKVLRSRD